jgi:membrane protease subunit HflK
VVNQAKGDANRFTSLMQEYEKAPKITRERMYIETLEEVLSQIDRFTVVDKEAKGLLPVYGPISQSLSPETSPKNKASN